MRRARQYLALGLLGTLCLGFAACQSAPIERRGTAVQSGDLLYGRLPSGRDGQAFSFEGVEGSLLDFDILADGGNIAAPAAELIDPEGRRIDIGAATTSARGAASMNVRDVVLLRNGRYRVNVRSQVKSHGVWYRFRHELRFPEIEPRTVRLSDAGTHPIYVSAPRRGLIAVTVQPARGSDVVPEIRGVKDPWGGRALDRKAVPRGAHPPRLSRGMGGQQVLTFTAPRPGRYTILAAAKRGTAGVARYAVEVRPPTGADRVVYHPNTSPNHGVVRRRARPAPRLVPPTRVVVPPASRTLPDPAIALR